jgi:hypothetical protein
MNKLPSPQELDRQARIKVDRWVDLYSDEVKMMDDDYQFTMQCVKLGFQEPAYLAVDFHGRIWGFGVDNIYHPFHFEYKNKLIGYKISKKAAN